MSNQPVKISQAAHDLLMDFREGVKNWPNLVDTHRKSNALQELINKNLVFPRTATSIWGVSKEMTVIEEEGEGTMQKKKFFIHIEVDENQKVVVCELVKSFEDLQDYERVVGLADDEYSLQIGSNSISFENMDYFYVGMVVGKALAAAGES